MLRLLLVLFFSLGASLAFAADPPTASTLIQSGSNPLSIPAITLSTDAGGQQELHRHQSAPPARDGAMAKAAAPVAEPAADPCATAMRPCAVLPRTDVGAQHVGMARALTAASVVRCLAAAASLLAATSREARRAACRLSSPGVQK